MELSRVGEQGMGGAQSGEGSRWAGPALARVSSSHVAEGGQEHCRDAGDCKLLRNGSCPLAFLWPKCQATRPRPTSVGRPSKVPGHQPGGKSSYRKDMRDNNVRPCADPRPQGVE